MVWQFNSIKFFLIIFILYFSLELCFWWNAASNFYFCRLRDDDEDEGVE